MAGEPVVHVIDDDEAAREALAFLIGCFGYRVRAYPSAALFLAQTDRIEPGCIVTDVRMPDMSGLELVERLSALGVTEPVIVITGHADVPMAVEAMRMGIAAFIEKPFGHQEIAVAIREALDGHPIR